MIRTALALFLACTAAAQGAAPDFVIRECSPAGVAAGARCGLVFVPENHGKSRGRKIALNVMVPPATRPNAQRKRAQYDLEGGVRKSSPRRYAPACMRP
jgi:hypothetical protein